MEQDGLVFCVFADPLRRGEALCPRTDRGRFKVMLAGNWRTTHVLAGLSVTCRLAEPARRVVR